MKGGSPTKAQEYYDQYAELIKDNPEKAAVTLLREFCGELNELRDKRNAKRPEAICSILKELNDKWNALSRIVVKNQGASPIRVDGFRRFWEANLPELEGYI